MSGEARTRRGPRCQDATSGPTHAVTGALAPRIARRRGDSPGIGRTTFAVFVAFAAAAALSACGTARRSEPFAHRPPLDAEEQLGERVFMKHCNQCHPEGEGGLGPALNNKPLPAMAIRTQIRAGLGEMPAFGADVIPEPELEAVAAYLVQLHSPSKDK